MEGGGPSRGCTVGTGTASITGLRGATRGPEATIPGTMTTTVPGKPATAIQTVSERRTTEKVTAKTKATEIGTLGVTGGTGSGIHGVIGPALSDRDFQSSAEAHRTVQEQGTTAEGGLRAPQLREGAGRGADQERGGDALAMTKKVLVVAVAPAPAVMSARWKDNIAIEKAGRRGKIGDGGMVVPDRGQGRGRGRGLGEDQEWRSD